MASLSAMLCDARITFHELLPTRSERLRQPLLRLRDQEHARQLAWLVYCGLPHAFDPDDVQQIRAVSSLAKSLFRVLQQFMKLRATFQGESLTNRRGFPS